MSGEYWTELGDISELNQKACIAKYMNKTSENICDALRDLVTFHNLKKVKNTHEGVLPLVKFISKVF